MKRILFLLCLLSLPVLAGPLDTLSNSDANGGLKEALIQGAGSATAALGKTDGFFANPKVKIPLPDTVKKVEPVLRMLGMGHDLDALTLSMNRAAEAAVPEAKTLLVNAVKSMTLSDAKAILTGGDDAATQYFKAKTRQPLSAKFLPIVRETTSRLKLTEQYNQLAGKAAAAGLMKADDATVEQYVTNKALDGLYLMIGEEEKAIRQDPVGATGKLAQKVFKMLK